jgi:hypothetical protein
MNIIRYIENKRKLLLLLLLLLLELLLLLLLLLLVFFYIGDILELKYKECCILLLKE